VADRNPGRALPDAPASDPQGDPTRVLETRLDVARKGYALVSDILTPQQIGLVVLLGVLAGAQAAHGVGEGVHAL